MRHKHQGAEIQRALDLYRTGMSAERVAQEIDPGSSKMWVLKAARSAGESRGRYDTRKRRIVRGGYVLLRMPSHPRADGKGYVKEHIVVWEQAHPDDPGSPSEVIHHKNGDKADNRPENLVKMSRLEHRQYKPRSKFQTGRGLVAKVGEDFAVSLGVRLQPEDVGHDGFLGKDRVEVKTSTGGRPGWAFQVDKEADKYLFVGVGEDRSPVAAWLIPVKAIGTRQNLSLTPVETRTRGKDPWNEYRVK